VFLAERRLIVGFLGMGAVSLNRPAMIDHPGTVVRHTEVTANPVFEEPQNWAEVYLQYGERIFRLPNSGLRELSDGTVVGSFKIAGSSVGNSMPVGRMKALGLSEIVMSRE